MEEDDDDDDDDVDDDDYYDWIPFTSNTLLNLAKQHKIYGVYYSKFHKMKTSMERKVEVLYWLSIWKKEFPARNKS